MTPEERRAAQSLGGRIGAHSGWARCEDRTAATAALRKGWNDRWERLADPDGVLSTQERALRAESLMKAHMLRMALKSAQARRRRKNSA